MLVVIGLVVVGGITAERAGPATPADAARGTAVSSVWLCPHGGGGGRRTGPLRGDPAHDDEADHDKHEDASPVRPHGVDPFIEPPASG